MRAALSGSGGLAPGLVKRERPEGLDRGGALVDFDDDLAPLVEDLRGVVAVLDLG
jgi:hypothetical protein